MWLPGLPHDVSWVGAQKSQFWSHKRETIQHLTITIHSEENSDLETLHFLRKVVHYTNKISYDIWISQKDKINLQYQ